MNPSGRMPERRTLRAAWKPYATMVNGGRLVGASLAALLTLLPAAPVAPQDCSYETPKGGCCPANGFAGYPANPAEETGANLYRLDRPEPSKYATNAILEYCSTTLSCNPATLTLDQKVAAVAWYVSKHMSWHGDDAQNRKPFAANGYGSYNPGPGSDFPQPADLTLKISGSVNGGVPNDDFQGDCEDHAILRAALLRARPYCLSPSAIWNALDSGPTHEYNIVLYKKAYRVMDYGTIDRCLPKHTAPHQSWYGWNEENAEDIKKYGVLPRGWTTTHHQYLIDKTNNCPSPKTSCAPWSYLNYYQDKCPCP